MRVLVTGASGYLGRAVAARALAAGWDVRALIRSGGAPVGAETVRGDMTTMDLVPALAGVDAVIHCAAAMTGPEDAMLRDTVKPAQRLAFAMSAMDTPPRLVLAGSMSVYAAGPERGLIEETSPLETDLAGRDAYTRAKIAQEQATVLYVPQWVCRIGAVWGPGRLWNGHIGVAKGPVALRMGAGEIPLCHVSRAAEALVAAAGMAPARREVVNVLDDARPDARRYLAALRQGGWPKVAVPVHWRIMDALAGIVPGGPGLLRRPALRARIMPRRYDAARTVARLGLAPSAPFADAMAEALRAEATQ